MIVDILSTFYKCKQLHTHNWNIKLAIIENKIKYIKRTYIYVNFFYYFYILFIAEISFICYETFYVFYIQSALFMETVVYLKFNIIQRNVSDEIYRVLRGKKVDNLNF